MRNRGGGNHAQVDGEDLLISILLADQRYIAIRNDNDVYKDMILEDEQCHCGEEQVLNRLADILMQLHWLRRDLVISPQVVSRFEVCSLEQKWWKHYKHLCRPRHPFQHQRGMVCHQNYKP